MPTTTSETLSTPAKISLLWVFVSLNYIYCDVLGHMDRQVLQDYLAGEISGVQVTQPFLLAAGALVEISFVMALLSRLLPERANRRANLVAGAFLTAVQAATLTWGTVTIYYAFYSVIEIMGTGYVVWLAYRWRSGRP
ncbi:DUF6326 family protein [Kineosporia rhizophila]|uniref:DUF6326 family protein n=1 Tax=Kineosporia TaxID=49184 RepID=UPI000A8C8013|nr:MULTISPECIES: DUF6326 family protein [Kineosporia]MCE0538593.1 DUF6326 family protein [Kineosporia rhizophila]GLY19618.1 hypothetical protein Kisp01_66320 [Kineosporia sp. NBRC 101677]